MYDNSRGCDNLASINNHKLSGTAAFLRCNMYDNTGAAATLRLN
jgi:hypothetical protein